MINAKIEENNRMGKTRDFFKKIRDTNEGMEPKQKQYPVVELVIEARFDAVKSNIA